LQPGEDNRRNVMRLVLMASAVLLVAIAGCGGAKSTPPKTEGQPGQVAEKSVQTNLPKLWDFWATWCPPCRELKPTIEALEKEYEGRIEIRSIDVDQEKELAQQFKIQAVPTLVFLDKEGKELARIVGGVPKDTILGRFRSLGFIE
jgi:thioredoxin